MTRYYFLSTMPLMLVYLASGCSSSDDSTPAPIALDTSVIRAYQQGDTFNASYTATEIATGQTLSGTVTLTIGDTVQNPYGINCRVVTASGTLTGSAGTVSVSDQSLFYQDTNSSLYECGEFDKILGRYVFLTDTATTPDGLYLDEQSPMQVGNITSGVATYDDGSWEDCTKTVQAIENVSTPLGLYESYKVKEVCSHSNGSTSDITLWVVPSIFTMKEIDIADDLSVEILITSYTLI